MKTKPIPDSKPVHPRSRILPSAMGIGGFHKQQRRKMVKSEATENGEDLSISRYISTQQGDLKVRIQGALHSDHHTDREIMRVENSKFKGDTCGKFKI
ncbi:hypothetical protein LXL04_023455 [Taraxacum kok-saghyz]